MKPQNIFVLNEVHTVVVLAAFDVDPHTSTRRVSIEIILAKAQFHEH